MDQRRITGLGNIYASEVLLPLAFVKPVAGRDLQVVEAGSQVDVFQLSLRPPGDDRREPFRSARRAELLSMPVRESLEHVLSAICHVTRVKQE